MATQDLTVLILAAGHGTRMKSKTLKLLHNAAGWPLIDHVKNVAESLEPRQIAFVVAPGMEALNARTGTHRTIVQSPAKGTGHAVQVAMADLGKLDGFVLVMLGDCPLVTQKDARAVLDACASADDVDAVFLAANVDNPYGLGRLIIENGKLTRIVEEADATPEQKQITLINGGFVALRAARLPELLKRINDKNAQGEIYLTDLPRLIAEDGRRSLAVETRPDHILGVNTRAQLAAVEAVLQARLRATALADGVTLVDPHTVHLSMDTVWHSDVVIEPNVVISGGVRLDEGSYVRAFSHLEDCHLKSGAVVGPFARIRGNSVLETGADMGNFVEVNRSNIGANVKAKHLTYLGDADIGAGSNIGAGTITCNYDGTNKSKTRIGAGSFIGSHATLVAPVAVGDGAYVAAGSVITQDVPQDALGLGRSRQENKTGWASRRRERSKKDK